MCEMSNICYAALTGHGVSDLLLQGVDVNTYDQNMNTLLHYAAHSGNLGTVRELLEAGAEILNVNQKGLTPLHFAAYGGSRSVLQELMKRRPDGINALSHKGSSLLHEAVRGRVVEAVESLLDNGANPNVQDKNRLTPLHMAVSQGSQLICRHLINHKADVKLRNQDGDTCLHLAALKGSLPICQLLIQAEDSLAGARDKDGETFLFRAVRGAARGNGKTHMDLMNWAVEHSGDMLCRNNDGLTVLDIARCVEAPLAITELIKKKTQEQQRSKLLKTCNPVHRSLVKLFMCGHSGVGKTTLANTLQQEGILPTLQYFFNTPEAPLSTKGVDITHTQLAGGTVVIWDFAGQMEYYFTHSLLLSTTSHSVIYFLLFSLEGIQRGVDQKKALDQIRYWLRFLSVTHGNKNSTKPRVFLIGSHYDKIPPELRAEIMQHFIDCLRTQCEELFNCFELDEFYVNCKSLLDLGPLRSKLEERVNEMMQDTMCQNIPSICHQVMETVGQICRTKNVKFMSWKDFLITVSKNLAGTIEEEQLRTAVEYLHNISELLYFPNTGKGLGSENGLVVLDLKWLCQDIFGTFGNFTLNSSIQETRERWKGSDLESRLKLDNSGNVRDVLVMLEQLELLFALPGTDEYIVPAWLSNAMAASVWKESKLFNMYHGVAYRWKLETGFFSQAFFARLQLRLLKYFTVSGGEMFLIWKDGIKCIDEAEVLMQVSESRLSINVIVRGYRNDSVTGSITSDTRSKCWGLLQSVEVHMGKLVAESDLDGGLEKLHLSPSDVQGQTSWNRELAAYNLPDVLAAAENDTSLCSKQAGVEDQPWNVLMAGYDVTVLTRFKRCARVRWLHSKTLHQLCCMLDPEHPTGQDWRALMEKIGKATTQDIRSLDADAGRAKCSATFLVFQRYPEICVNLLYHALHEMEREDCTEELDTMLRALDE